MENRRVSPARSAALSGFEERAKPDWGEVVGPTGPLGSRAHSATELHILGQTVESAIGAADTTPISAAARYSSRAPCSGPNSKTASKDRREAALVQLLLRRRRLVHVPRAGGLRRDLFGPLLNDLNLHGFLSLLIDKTRLTPPALSAGGLPRRLPARAAVAPASSRFPSCLPSCGLRFSRRLPFTRSGPAPRLPPPGAQA